MVGAGQLIKLLFGLDYNIAIRRRHPDDGVRHLGGMVATTWVQIIKACMLLAGGTLVMFLALASSASRSRTCSRRRPLCTSWSS
jgi:cation/acetate symporter